ncbi:hypothetical protein GCM10011360_17870 [Primorskyibacter flagellatus]|uniref:Putative exodeoxyribonuclease 8 PDDEXK-like domain-containing protein n=1 Tax=Primorskyibacter flagellatus TaxID=1387277 RepID=A0A917A6Q6_9RHOB|nr:PD-(D/E)XK nuclease-like domain-containing protein [Primorskyibacter flagellatus]GGE30258.1 hypothetical protein GCM10011360_17870 [Primorskyibacter flagellatus]
MSHEIRTLADDEQITEPGFYRISLDRHHSQPCDGPSVTSGVLRTMEKKGPSKVWAYHQLNPNRFEEKRSDALRMGTAMAAYIEGGLAGLEAEFQILPENAPSRPTAAQINALKEGRETETARRSITFWSNVRKDGREIVSQGEFDLLAAMGAALAADPAAAAVLGGEPEITMAAFDERTGLWMLARPDNMNFDGTLSDYKKVNTQGRPFNQTLCSHRTEDHEYTMQMAFAADVFERLTGIWSDQCGLVFQEDEPPHDVILLPIPEEDLRIGQFLNRQAMTRFRECLDANHWPGPGEVITPFHRNPERREALLERMQTAGAAP